MDYSRWTATTQPNPPNPNPPIDPYTSIYTPHYPYYPHHLTQTPNPNPQNPLKPHETYIHAGLDPGLRPPGVDPYASLSSYPHAHHRGYEPQAQAAVAYAHQPADTGSLAACYQDPNAPNWAAKEAVRHYGINPVGYGAGVTIPPSGTEQLVTAIPNSTLWTNPAIRPRGIGTWKRVPKKTKIVQSAYCEVCKVDCSSKDVLENHKLGKKHKRNLEKLKEAIAPAPGASAGSNKPVIGPLENPKKGKAVSGQNTKKKAADSAEDLETKRRKIMEGGAAADAVRTCAICNVVCNSETVFNYHLAGQKHSAMVKRLTAGVRVAH